MDSLTLFGLFAVTAMLLFYALEDRSSWYVLAFAGACALAYGFLQGAWPFGVVEAIWAAVAIHRWRNRIKLDSERIKGFCAAQPAQKACWADAGRRPVGLRALWRFHRSGADRWMTGRALTTSQV